MWGNVSRRALHLDDEGAAAHALEAAPGPAHAEGGLQLGGSCHAPGMAPFVAALDEDRHPPEQVTGDPAHRVPDPIQLQQADERPASFLSAFMCIW